MSTPQEVHARPRSDAGFTLLEIAVATAIMALLMLAVLGVVTGTANARKRIQEESTTRSVGPVILDMIASDIEGVFTYGMENFEGFLGEDRVELGAPADRINMITTSDSVGFAQVGNGEERTSDVCEVGYVATASQTDSRYLALYRREEFTPAGEPYRGGTYRLLYDRIAAFDVVYYAGGGDEREEGSDEWASSEERRLPRTMEVVLRLDVAAEGEEALILEFKRLIAFAPGTDVEIEEAVALFQPDASERGEAQTDDDGTAGGGGGGGGGRRGREGRQAGGRDGRQPERGRRGRGRDDSTIDELFGDGF